MSEPTHAREDRERAEAFLRKLYDLCVDEAFVVDIGDGELRLYDWGSHGRGGRVIEWDSERLCYRLGPEGL